MIQKFTIENARTMTISIMTTAAILAAAVLPRPFFDIRIIARKPEPRSCIIVVELTIMTNMNIKIFEISYSKNSSQPRAFSGSRVTLPSIRSYILTTLI